jgi:hypothetical protein
MYPGWHPQRDPSGCYFGHDHGSDPSYFSAADEYQPAFGYVNAVVGMSEPPAGFKVFRVVEADGQQWLWTVHMGTSGYGRVCQSFHSIELAIADRNGSLLAEIRWIADFGKSETNDNRGSFQPATCPNQASDASARGSVGVRQLSVNQVGPYAQQYEPWKPDLRNTVFGFPATTNTSLGGGHIQFNNKSSMTTCDDVECNSMSLTNHRGGGAYSVIQSTNFAIRPTRSGHFTTDMLGQSVGGFVPQYLAPGWTSAALTHSCSSSPCNWFPGVDPNVVEYRSRSNDQLVKDGKGGMEAYNIDDMLRPPN